MNVQRTWLQTLCNWSLAAVLLASCIPTASASTRKLTALAPAMCTPQQTGRPGGHGASSPREEAAPYEEVEAVAVVATFASTATGWAETAEEVVIREVPTQAEDPIAMHRSLKKPTYSLPDSLSDGFPPCGPESAFYYQHDLRLFIDRDHWNREAQAYTIGRSKRGSGNRPAFSDVIPELVVTDVQLGDICSFGTLVRQGGSESLVLLCILPADASRAPKRLDWWRASVVARLREFVVAAKEASASVGTSHPIIDLAPRAMRTLAVLPITSERELVAEALRLYSSVGSTTPGFRREWLDLSRCTQGILGPDGEHEDVIEGLHPVTVARLVRLSPHPEIQALARERTLDFYANRHGDVRPAIEGLLADGALTLDEVTWVSGRQTRTIALVGTLTALALGLGVFVYFRLRRRSSTQEG